MTDALTKLICPNCQFEIPLTEILMTQVTESIKAEVMTQNEAEMQRQKAKSEKQLAALKAHLLKEKAAELSWLQAALSEKDKLVSEARQNELKLRLEKEQLEDAKRAFLLEKQRQLDIERAQIRASAEKQAYEELQFKIAEKDKQLDDARKVNTDLQRKLRQGSEQARGEVLELELENALKVEFMRDEILPVPKGINGADILQKVYTNFGQYCGAIIWETKRTKNWQEIWLSKLKEDQREVNAEIAILVSEILPPGCKNFMHKEGVFITNYALATSLAQILRAQLITLEKMRTTNVGKNEKLEELSRYLSGPAFRHKIEAIAEAFTNMKQELESEKRAIIKIWARREKQIEQILNNTVKMYGNIEGLLGNAIEPITALEFRGDELFSALATTETKT